VLNKLKEPTTLLRDTTSTERRMVWYKNGQRFNGR